MYLSSTYFHQRLYFCALVWRNWRNTKHRATRGKEIKHTK
jgi:hypothetical protein